MNGGEETNRKQSNESCPWSMDKAKGLCLTGSGVHVVKWLFPLLLPERRISLLSLTCMVCKEHTCICFAYRPSSHYQPSELSLLPGAKSQGPPLHPGRGSSKGWKEPGLATHSPLDFLSPSLAKPHFWKAGFTFYESGQCKKKLISYRAVHRWIGGGGGVWMNEASSGRLDLQFVCSVF